MATGLTAQQQEDVEFYYQQVLKNLRLSRELTDPVDKETHYELAKNYPTRLRKAAVPEVIVAALEERLKPPASAPAASGPNGGRKSRKQSKKKRATRRKYLKNSNRK
jgi:hypothetical protein